MAMALTLFPCLTLLAIFPSIAVGSSYYSRSFASSLRYLPPHSLPSSARGGYGRLRSGAVSSFLEGKLKVTYRNQGNDHFSHKGKCLKLLVLALETGNSSSQPSAPPSSSNGKLALALKWLAGVALGAVAGAVSGFLASHLFISVRGFVEGREADQKPVVFQRKFLDAKALDFFKKPGAMENLELLGRGGSGEVFKATFDNGITVAIKRVFAITWQETVNHMHVREKRHGLTKKSAQIAAELNTLGRIRHLNLVDLLAYIPQPSAHLLIYEYMENGSLQNVMSKLAMNEVELPWASRLAIAKDVATGLKYLHFDCNPAIIHRDLKPGNILLDKNMIAHIGDFGLAKAIPDTHTHITSQNVAGTLGYIAPEYHQTLKYSAKGDMYAFGVVLVVLVTGKEPIHSFFADLDVSMEKWLANAMALGEESVKRIVDPSLQGHGDEQEIILTLKVASLCLQKNPGERPNADDVLKMLKQIKPSQQQPPLPSVEFLACAV